MYQSWQDAVMNMMAQVYGTGMDCVAVLDALATEHPEWAADILPYRSMIESGAHMFDNVGSAIPLPPQEFGGPGHE